jgi:hypothetical protein
MEIKNPLYIVPKTLSRWFEGMRQKGWTLTTILLILLAADKIGTVAELIWLQQSWFQAKKFLLQWGSQPVNMWITM